MYCCTLKIYVCTLKVYVLYFESILFELGKFKLVFCKYNSSLLNIYCCTFEVSVLYIDLLLYFERWISILCKTNLVVSNNSFILLKEYIFTSEVYFYNLKIYFCILKAIFYMFKILYIYLQFPLFLMVCILFFARLIFSP